VANPFNPPSSDAATSALEPSDPFAEVVGLVTGMRFPQLLFGGLYGLLALVVTALGAIGFLGGLGAGPDERLVILAGSAFYLVTGALGLLPSGLLVRSGLAALLASSSDDDDARDQVLTSLRAQLWFWRVLALYLLGMTLLYGAAFFVLVGLGMLGTLG
jgi:hypothetical protein